MVRNVHAKKIKTSHSKKSPLFVEKLARPTQSLTHKWCDFIELRCLVSSESRVSRGQIIEVLDDSALLYGESTDADDPFLDADVLNGVGIDEQEEDEEISLPNPAPLRNSLKNEARAAEWFQSIEFRAGLFGTAYPFELSDDRQELKLKKNLLEVQRFYIQLLLSSSLRFIPKTRWGDLTEPFESLSEKIFSSLMPKGWNVFRFGAKGSTRYKGKLFDKLTALAKDIRAEFNAPAYYYDKNNTGDGGLDLVAWHPMGDDRIGIPVALAQCGCVADEWAMKTLEASPARLSANLRPPNPWATYYFMPHDLVYNAGKKTDWQQGNDLTNSIIIDRYRFVKLAIEYDLVGAGILATGVVDEALQATTTVA